MGHTRHRTVPEAGAVLDAQLHDREMLFAAAGRKDNLANALFGCPYWRAPYRIGQEFQFSEETEMAQIRIRLFGCLLAPYMSLISYTK